MTASSSYEVLQRLSQVILNIKVSLSILCSQCIPINVSLIIYSEKLSRLSYWGQSTVGIKIIPSFLARNHQGL